MKGSVPWHLRDSYSSHEEIEFTETEALGRLERGSLGYRVVCGVLGLPDEKCQESSQRKHPFFPG